VPVLPNVVDLKGGYCRPGERGFSDPGEQNQILQSRLMLGRLAEGLFAILKPAPKMNFRGRPIRASIVEPPSTICRDTACALAPGHHLQITRWVRSTTIAESGDAHTAGAPFFADSHESARGLNACRTSGRDLDGSQGERTGWFHGAERGCACPLPLVARALANPLARSCSTMLSILSAANGPAVTTKKLLLVVGL
jgi:hypothetical protein